MSIPPNRKWVQVNDSDSKGSLFSSMNLDLTTNVGSTRLSPRTIISTNDITDLGIPVAFKIFTDQNAGVQYAWSIAGSYVWRMLINDAGLITAFAKDGSTGTPTNLSSDTSDLEYMGSSFMVVTGTTNLQRYNASNGQWNDGGTELTGGSPHSLSVYRGRFYVTDASTKIKSFLPANYAAITASGDYTLDLSATTNTYPITTISTHRPVSNGLWVFTINQREDGCYAFKWDAVTSNVAVPYIINDASGVLACVIKDDVPWIIDNNARLMYFNGGTFVPAPNGKLPVKNSKFLKNPLSAVNDRFIHPNGIGLVDNKIRILVNNEHEDNGATIDERFPSGVWEYTPDGGWSHIMSLSLYTSTVTDYGQNRVSRVGALYCNKTETTSATANGTMLMGAQIYSDATTTKEIIAYDDSNDTLQKYGYFVTTKIFSQNIQDAWNGVYARFKKLLSATDSIVVKYRTSDVEPTEATITWTDTNTFTSSTNLSAYVIGDEVEVIQGTGSGKCAHITAISENAGTYTVDLDDTFTGATGTAKARLQKWIKSADCTDQSLQHMYFPMDLHVVAPWIQFKVCMQFTGKNELYDLIPDHTKHN